MIYSMRFALYDDGALYRMAGIPNDLAGSRGVIPQLPIGFCMANCDRIQDDFLRSICNVRCFDQPDGSGGGGGQLCTPGCGPCYSDPDSPTGRARTCIRRNCDDYPAPANCVMWVTFCVHLLIHNGGRRAAGIGKRIHEF
jgi:hypothetical protein